MVLTSMKTYHYLFKLYYDSLLAVAQDHGSLGVITPINSERGTTMFTAAIATVIYGGAAVLHSSGLVIASGSAGYVAGTIGSTVLTTLYLLPF